jgi:signal transduction histidine kinase/ligand-binding sensor domain-containing protein/DNA-binding response OmpR family regulator
MRIRISILFGISTFILTLQLAAQQEINFTALTTKNGLSSNTVNSILKDHFGLIWLGTDDGLNRFDGTNVTVYRHNPTNPSSLRSNEILSVHEDKKGNLWVGTSGGSLSLYDRQKDAFINFPSGKGTNTISNSVINSICSDYLGKVWLGHYNGVNILDPETKKVSNISLASGSFNAKPCLFLFEDSRHCMWIGTNQGVFRYDPKTKSIVQFQHSNEDPSSLADNNITTIAEDKRGNIWVGTLNGLSMLQGNSSRFINYTQNNTAEKTLSNNAINSIDFDGDNLWIGTGGGLDILDTQTGVIRKFGLDYRNIYSLSSPSIRYVYIDNQGIYWLGTLGGGVNRYDKNLNIFNQIRSNVFDEKGLKAAFVSSFAEDRTGQIFVGTQGGGLALFNPKTKLFQRFDIRSGRTGAQNYLTVLALKMNRSNRLMIGTYSEGLFIMDPVSGSYQQLIKGDNKQDLNSNDIFCIEEDSKGNIWLGTNGRGVDVLNQKNEVITHYTPDPKFSNDIKLPLNAYIRDIEEDREGMIWIATYGGGIARLQPSTGKFTIYNTSNSKLPNDKVQCIFEDSRGNIWAGTFGGGIALFEKRTNQFFIISEKEGLPNNTVYQIVEDQKGLIWISTNKAISSFDLNTRKINSYNYHNGVQNNNFISGSGIRSSKGEIFFGSFEGFNYFNPAYLKKNNTPPAVMITDLRIANRSITPSEDGPIKEHIFIAKKISLAYRQSFALNFVGVNYTSPGQNQYAYKLEGFDKDWNYVGNTNTVSYTNLDPGEYVFRVKASNNDGVWNNEGASIKIVVLPPFWRTYYAYILYSLLVTAGVLYFRYISIQKLKRQFALEQIKNQAAQQRKESERIHELDMLKLKFLTNLSHEFRTPISLILGPTETLLSQEKNKDSSAELHIVKRNAKRLLNLVNQLLDFRKMEEHELKLQPSEGDLVSFIKEVCDSFKDISERKKIDFVFNTKVDQLYTAFDHDKIERILFNVLSNAFKFTLEGGKISLQLEKTERNSDPSNVWVAIKITDTGIGIPHDKKEKIFDRFFQNSTSASILNQGTGIGLSITKEFVKMHGGTIEVESEIEKGTSFKINLPFTPLTPQNANSEVAIEEETTKEIELPVAAETNGFNSGNTTEMPSILLVEDNEDFRFYLKANLRLHYKVFEAADGKEGWQKTLAHHPLLVVSDINMPNMDGIELTQKLKSDKRTSHIPIILLTALTGEEDQLRGLGTGANDYITKPFNFEILNAKIKNLLLLNSTLKNVYSKQIKVLTPEVKIESDDEKLLTDITLYLEENLTNPDLSVEELSRHVGMSRSSLYNKILEITGQTPVEFIRSYKLDKAAVLLEKSDMNIAQVGYSVGFSTPNYFAKSFKAKFNMLPSEYIKKRKVNGDRSADVG